jgi:carbon storage regulator
MLVLTRKLGQRFVIGDSIIITVLNVESRKVRLGIEAPTDFKILREELQEGSRDWQPALSLVGKTR